MKNEGKNQKNMIWKFNLLPTTPNRMVNTNGIINLIFFRKCFPIVMIVLFAFWSLSPKNDISDIRFFSMLFWSLQYNRTPLNPYIYSALEFKSNRAYKCWKEILSNNIYLLFRLAFIVLGFCKTMMNILLRTFQHIFKQFIKPFKKRNLFKKQKKLIKSKW